MLSMRKFVLPPTNENSWSRRSNQSILREINPEYSLEGWTLKMKLQYFGHLIQKYGSLEQSWCWERTKAEGEEDVRGWDGWMTSLMQWTWTWADSGRYWGTGMPGMLQSMGSQRVTHDWVTEQQQMKVTIKSLENYFPF